MIKRKSAYSEVLLVQVSIFVKKGTIGFKNVKFNNYALSSLEKVSRILEDDYGLSSSS